MKVELLLNARCELAESPAWEAETGTLFFVDIPRGEVHALRPETGDHQVIEVGESAGCLAPAGREALVLGLRSGIWKLDLPSRSKSLLCDVESGLPGNRFNDGKCDPAGRFLAGTMDDAEQQASGSLYSYSFAGLKKLLGGVRISNGLTWSPDSRTFYFIDTPTRLVMAYDYDLEEGAISAPRPVIHVPEGRGWPDGMTADMEGMLWIAMWGGAQLTRWDPASGELLAAVPVPALQVTSCVFGGSDHEDLYITTAGKGLTVPQRTEYPLSGSIFRMASGTRGAPTHRFSGGFKRGKPLPVLK